MNPNTTGRRPLVFGLVAFCLFALFFSVIFVTHSPSTTSSSSSSQTWTPPSTSPFLYSIYDRYTYEVTSDIKGCGTISVVLTPEKGSQPFTKLQTQSLPDQLLAFLSPSSLLEGRRLLVLPLPFSRNHQLLIQFLPETTRDTQLTVLMQNSVTNHALIQRLPIPICNCPNEDLENNKTKLPVSSHQFGLLNPIPKEFSPLISFNSTFLYLKNGHQLFITAPLHQFTAAMLRVVNDSYFTCFLRSKSELEIYPISPPLPTKYHSPSATASSLHLPTLYSFYLPSELPVGEYMLHVHLLLERASSEPGDLEDTQVIHTSPWSGGELQSCKLARSHILGSPFPVKVLQRTAPLPIPVARCTGPNHPGKWVRSSSSSSWEWRPYSCLPQKITSEDLFHCSAEKKIKRIHIMGAGELLEIANGLARMMKGIETQEEGSLEKEKEGVEGVTAVSDNGHSLRLTYSRSSWSSSPSKNQRSFEEDKNEIESLITGEIAADVLLVNAGLGNQLLFQTLTQGREWINQFAQHFGNSSASTRVIWFSPMFFWGPKNVFNRHINAARLDAFKTYANRHLELNGISVVDPFTATSARPTCPSDGFLYSSTTDSSCFSFALQEVLASVLEGCSHLL